MANLFFDQLTAEQRADVATLADLSTWQLILPALERVSASIIHVFTCVAIVLAVRNERWSWFWLAFGYKTLVDTLAAVGVERFNPADSVINHVGFEATFVVLALVGLAGLRRLHTKFRELDTAPVEEVAMA